MRNRASGQRIHAHSFLAMGALTALAVGIITELRSGNLKEMALIVLSTVGMTVLFVSFYIILWHLAVVLDRSIHKRLVRCDETDQK